MRLWHCNFQQIILRHSMGNGTQNINRITIWWRRWRQDKLSTCTHHPVRTGLALYHRSLAFSRNFYERVVNATKVNINDQIANIPICHTVIISCTVCHPLWNLVLTCNIICAYKTDTNVGVMCRISQCYVFPISWQWIYQCVLLLL